jgi:hypothetical protein
LLGFAVAGAIVLPFAVWSPQATWDYGFVFALRRTSFRYDSLSIPAALYPFTRTPWGKLPSLAAQSMVGIIAVTRLRAAGFSGFALASTLILFAGFLAGWQAFLNYYFLVGGMLVISGAAAAGTAATK